MRSAVRALAKDSRIEVRVDPEFKGDFTRYCKKNKKNPSVVARKALQQAVAFGDFKTHLFELLHNYPEAKFHFEKFLHLTHINSHEVGMWFEDLLGPEEKNLVENTPPIFLAGLKDVLVTQFGRTALKEKLHKCQK